MAPGSTLSIRRYRICGMSIFDIVGGMLAMILLFLIAWRWHFHDLSPWPFVGAAVLVTVPVANTAHVLFGVNTSLNYSLGLSHNPK
jgi:hypothetical protein